ncbi:hypothetical protein LRR81_16140 [Metabacillus sp. GX 13764]|uniref:hypothetical protein n=1 Tax=Metabacillus kandeliae TaxID=2900151 RepID=UPI001E3DDEC9|nr:hypothetical protein [Metabacillus kandeliae]MCD7035775.1 hypothetical protein [Metabacillus kandeliae]
MEIIDYSYKKRGRVEFVFSTFPHSKAMLYPIKNYFFVRYVTWDERDPIVTKADLEEMEMLANKHFGRESWYKKRKNPTSSEQRF